ncbi:MAG: type II toxin-antitoxin system HicB family antitoxin [Clostridia bacterium]
MHQFLYPAVFFKDEEDFLVYFPDLDISTQGSTVEEAFLFAKDYLRAYLTEALKHELDYELPTKFEDVCKKYRNGRVFLVDVILNTAEFAK